MSSTEHDAAAVAAAASAIAAAAESGQRPTFIAIHARDDDTQVLYISSGCRQAMGYTPAYVISRRARDFIADPFEGDYPQIYGSKVDEQEAEEDEANAYVMYMNIKNLCGTPVLHRITTFKCDNCILVIGMAFPEVPFRGRHELEVQMLDGAMKRFNITKQNEEEESAMRRQQQQQQGDDMAAAATVVGGSGRRVQLYYAPSRQVKVAMVLESPAILDTVTGSDADRRQNGPLIVFVTGSVSRLIDADTSDLLRFPFLKLVAPEDVLRATRFFERLGESQDVLFESFALIQRPHVIDGDVAVADDANTRVVVECLGASVQDGVALLLRRLRTAPPPGRDALGNYVVGRRYRDAHEHDCDTGYMSLNEMISSDPGTSDAPPSWSNLR
ncbi:hypothetical protein IWW38_000733 [Coemansia aciculifera]|uniref:Uncharacterized protein n=1 Tax=Coemansia aciculifera TaxID=417176 RepID=A0ACC1MA51_9FUNG|nr:hypothetical protein IWW38_000733 [Coemansia aciculifera]